MTLMRVRNLGPEHNLNNWTGDDHLEDSWLPAPIPLRPTPLGEKVRVAHSPTMLKELVALQWDRAAAERLAQVGLYLFNRDSRYSDSIPLDGPWPNGEPLAQPITSILNIVNVLERRGSYARIECLQPGPIPAGITPITHPHLFVWMKSLKVGTDQTGNAGDDRGLVHPLFAVGEAWLPWNYLEAVPVGYTITPKDYPPITQEERTMNTFPPINKGAAIWMLSQNFNGDPKRICDFAQSLGVQTFTLKVGNGLTRWQNLEAFIEHARGRGFTVLGWWYYFGYAGEGDVSASHTAYLVNHGLQGLQLDVEKQFDASVGAWTASTVLQQRTKLEPKAHAIGQALRAQLPKLPIALASWRFPEQRPTPTRVFLQYCDANSPMVYSLGTGGPAPVTAAQRINDAIARYQEPAHGGWTGPTIPFVAAYHEAGNYVTVPQLAAVNARAQELKLPGLFWWALNYLIEKADWATEIRSHNWPVSYTAPAPEPPTGDQAEAVRLGRHGELDAVVAWAQTRKAEVG